MALGLLQKNLCPQYKKATGKPSGSHFFFKE